MSTNSAVIGGWAAFLAWTLAELSVLRGRSELGTGRVTLSAAIVGAAIGAGRFCACRDATTRAVTRTAPTPERSCTCRRSAARALTTAAATSSAVAGSQSLSEPGRCALVEWRTKAGRVSTRGGGLLVLGGFFSLTSSEGSAAFEEVLTPAENERNRI